MGETWRSRGWSTVCMPLPLRNRCRDSSLRTRENKTKSGPWKAIFWLWVIGGVIVALFGAMNFYTHIGFGVNTQ